MSKTTSLPVELQATVISFFVRLHPERLCPLEDDFVLDLGHTLASKERLFPLNTATLGLFGFDEGVVPHVKTMAKDAFHTRPFLIVNTYGLDGIEHWSCGIPGGCTKARLLRCYKKHVFATGSYTTDEVFTNVTIRPMEDGGIHDRWLKQNYKTRIRTPTPFVTDRDLGRAIGKFMVLEYEQSPSSDRNARLFRFLQQQYQYCKRNGERILFRDITRKLSNSPLEYKFNFIEHDARHTLQFEEDVKCTLEVRRDTNFVPFANNQQRLRCRQTNPGETRVHAPQYLGEPGRVFRWDGRFYVWRDYLRHYRRIGWVCVALCVNDLEEKEFKPREMTELYGWLERTYKNLIIIAQERRQRMNKPEVDNVWQLTYRDIFELP